MTRIIAGRAKGRSLQVAKVGTRPTADRVRESVFSSLDHLVGGWSEVSVLDLYAGSGAFGLEALSRGAQAAVLVERSRAAVTAIATNIEATGLTATVSVSSVAKFLSGPGKPYDVVFIDPPYELAQDAVDDDLTQLVSQGWLADAALVIVERSSRSSGPIWPTGFTEPTSRRFGDTVVHRSIWYVS